MKVIVPHTVDGLHPLVVPVLRSQGHSPTLYRLDHVGDYSKLMQAIWNIGETTVLVEQDVLPWPGAIDELKACPCIWGTYSYLKHGGIGIAHMLGCAKITDELIQRLPELWSEPSNWNKLDQRLFFAAQEIEIEPHLHRPPVIHLNTAELNA